MNAFLEAASTLLTRAFGGGSPRLVRTRPPAQAGVANPGRPGGNPGRRVAPPGEDRFRGIERPSNAAGLGGTGLRPPEPSRPYWGGVHLLSEDEVLHFAVCGCTGSGKTLEIRQLMRSVLTGMRADEDRRALIYDAKRDTYPFLHALGLGGLVLNLNPFDRRSVAWNIAADIGSAAEIEQFSGMIIPPNPNEHNPFFTDAARILLRSAITALQRQKPGQWTLRDVVLIVTNPQRLRELLSRCMETRELAENFFEAREFPSVMSTIETKVRPLGVVAALWQRAERRISLRRDWIERGSIVLLAYQPAYSQSLEPINRAIFRFLSDEMLARPNDRNRRSWVFLDEAREAGRLDGLRKLLTQGRDKGICVVLGFQDIEGMREVYGRETANEQIGQCNHKTFLRSDNPDTAVWMENHINKALLRSRQVARDKDGKNTTTESLRIDHTVLASDFLGIPVTSHRYGRRALHLSSRIPKPYWTDIPLQEILERVGPVPAEVPGEDPRGKADQELLPWSPGDAARLGFPVGDRATPAALPTERPSAVAVTPPPPVVEASRDGAKGGAGGSSPEPSPGELLWSATRRRGRTPGEEPSSAAD